MATSSWIKAHLARSGRGDNVALLAYVERDGRHHRRHAGDAAESARCQASCDLRRVRPRFLHSTGQAYKGGPDSGVFLQVTADDAQGSSGARPEASFGVIKAAQARGDFDVLTERGRRALAGTSQGRSRLGLAALDAAISAALN